MSGLSGEADSIATKSGVSSSLLGVLLMVAALAVLALEWRVPKDDSQLSRTAQVATDKSGLLVRGAIDEAEIDAGASVRVWILVHNQSTADVLNLSIVDFQTPGLAQCWSSPRPAACRGDKQQMYQSTDLKPGASTLFSGDLTPLASSGRYYLTATYGWKNPAGGELRNVLQIGPVEVSSKTNRAVVNVGRRVRDMVVPIALFVLGVLVQRRDDKQKKAEDARARSSAKATAVLNSLLTANMRDTQRYYLPLVLRTSELLLAIDDVNKNLAGARDRCVFATVCFFKRQRWMGENIGGLHFQNRDGEGVAAGLWAAVLELYEATFFKRASLGCAQADRAG